MLWATANGCHSDEGTIIELLSCQRVSYGNDSMVDDAVVVVNWDKLCWCSL